MGLQVHVPVDLSDHIVSDRQETYSYSSILVS